jgi:hypothetical protein
MGLRKKQQTVEPEVFHPACRFASRTAAWHSFDGPAADGERSAQ